MGLKEGAVSVYAKDGNLARGVEAGFITGSFYRFDAYEVIQTTLCCVARILVSLATAMRGGVQRGDGLRPANQLRTGQGS